MKDGLPIATAWKEATYKAVEAMVAQEYDRFMDALRSEYSEPAIGSVRFAYCMKVVASCYGNNYTAVARDTQVRGAQFRRWIQGRELPGVHERKRIVDMCIDNAAAVQNGGLNLLFPFLHESLEKEAVFAAVQFAAPSDDTDLGDVAGFDELPVALRAVLRNENITTFGALRGKKEINYLVMSGMGRKLMNKLRGWLATFGVTLQ